MYEIGKWLVIFWGHGRIWHHVGVCFLPSRNLVISYPVYVVLMFYLSYVHSIFVFSFDSTRVHPLSKTCTVAFGLSSDLDLLMCPFAGIWVRQVEDTSRIRTRVADARDAMIGRSRGFSVQRSSGTPVRDRAQCVSGYVILYRMTVCIFLELSMYEFLMYSYRVVYAMYFIPCS